MRENAILDHWPVTIVIITTLAALVVTVITALHHAKSPHTDRHTNQPLNELFA